MKHPKKPVINIKPVDDNVEEEVVDKEDGSQKTEEKKRPRRERRHGFDITKIITKIFSEENEVDE